MLENLFGGFGFGGGAAGESKPLSSSTATTTISDQFGDNITTGGAPAGAQWEPVILVGAVVLAVVAIAAFAFRR